MERYYVKDVIEGKFNVGEQIVLDAYVKSCVKKSATNGSDYLDLILADNEHEINAKVWNVGLDTIEFLNSSKYIRAVVEINEFKGSLQLKVKKCGNIPEMELDERKLVKTAPEPVNSLIEELEETIDMIGDGAIRHIVRRLYEKNKKRFVIWPAARSMHHNYPSGLLYHTVSMLRLAKNNLNQYPGKLDKDIVLGAIILHDMAKVVEYSDAYKPEFTEYGELMGHVFLSAAEVYCEAKQLKTEDDTINFDKVKYLIHAILAHHGKKEWGAPVEPKTIEAEIVHQIDMMDSRMNMTYK